MIHYEAFIFLRFLQNGGTYGIIELSLWVVRALVSVSAPDTFTMNERERERDELMNFFLSSQIIGTICLHSQYSFWRDEKSVLRSLQELSVVRTGGDYWFPE